MEKQIKDFLQEQVKGATFKMEDVADATVLEIEKPVAVKSAEELQKLSRRAKLIGSYKKLNQYLLFLSKVSPKEKVNFYHLMSVMIQAGISMLKALEIMVKQTENKRLQSILLEVHSRVEAGAAMSDTLKQYPKIFDESEVGMIRSGEESGQLTQVLDELARTLESRDKTMKQVKGALIYPSMILLALVIVVTVMMVWVVPKISELFVNTGKELPKITQYLIATSNFMINSWYVLFGGIGAVIIAVVLLKKTKPGKYAWDYTMIKMPIFGQLTQKAILSRFSRSLASLLKSGIAIIQALKINAHAVGNEVYKKRILTTAEDVSRGIKIADNLQDSPLFPSMMVHMLAIGEKTAQLDTISETIADFYEEEVANAVETATKFMQPLIVILVGGVVGTIMMAIMLPITQLMNIGGSI